MVHQLEGKQYIEESVRVVLQIFTKQGTSFNVM